MIQLSTQMTPCVSGLCGVRFHVAGSKAEEVCSLRLKLMRSPGSHDWVSAPSLSTNSVSFDGQINPLVLSGELGDDFNPYLVSDKLYCFVEDYFCQEDGDGEVDNLTPEILARFINDRVLTRWHSSLRSRPHGGVFVTFNMPLAESHDSFDGFISRLNTRAFVRAAQVHCPESSSVSWDNNSSTLEVDLTDSEGNVTAGALLMGMVLDNDYLCTFSGPLVSRVPLFARSDDDVHEMVLEEKSRTQRESIYQWYAQKHGTKLSDEQLDEVVSWADDHLDDGVDDLFVLDSWLFTMTDDEEVLEAMPMFL